MTGGSIAHNDIALNFYRALYPHLRPRGCRVNVADVKVQVRCKEIYYYLDVVVSCDPSDRQSHSFIEPPTLIAEVLSPGTSARDRGEKLTNYLTIPSFQEYVLIDSQQVSVERYCRDEGRMWLYFPHQPGDRLTLSSLDFDGEVEKLYEDVVFSESEDDAIEKQA